LALGALLCCAFCFEGSARAAEPVAPLVVVLSSDPDAPFVRRLAAELSLFGYGVQVAQRSSEDPELTSELQRSGGAALISVDPAGQSAEVVVGASATGGVQRERERLDPRRRDDTNAAVLAERFRARLTELGISPVSAPVGEPVPPPPSLPATPQTEEQRLWVAASFGVMGGGLGPMPEVELELRALPVAWLSTSAFGKITPWAAQVSAPEGEARVRLLSGGIAIDTYPLRGSPSAKVGLTAQLMNASMSGQAEAPWAGQDDAVLVPAASLRAGVAWRLGQRSQVELSGFAGACAPRIGVHFAGRSVADFGQPFVGGSLGFSWGVF
jgi:hypothetical protein